MSGTIQAGPKVGRHAATPAPAGGAQRFDAGECRAFLAQLHEPGTVFEVRVLNSRRGTVSGYFNDPERAVQAAAQWSGQAPAVYFTLNPVNPALLARSNNRLTPYAKQTASDNDITYRRWFLVDTDPCRPSGISSTDNEKASAMELALQVRQWLTDQGWPAPIYADSGNGAHLLYRIDLPNDADSRGLVENSLKALAFQFDGDAVKVDAGNGNAARICKLYGTRACKGDSTEDRPHRLARVLDRPAHCEAVPMDLLHALAAQQPALPEPANHRSGPNLPPREFDLERWIVEHGLPVVRSGSWQGRDGAGRKWILDPCPLDSTHTGGCAYVIQKSDGTIAAGCHHDTCIKKGLNWHTVRKLFEPGWEPYQPMPEPRFDRTHSTGSPQQEAAKDPKGGFVSFVSAQGKESGREQWPELQPLPDSLPAVEPFEFGLLPEAFRPWIEDIAERMQCPPDYLGIGAMVALGAVVGRQVGIHPKRLDDWLVVPNLWGAAIGPPSLMKSPALQEILGALHRLESQARESHEQALFLYEADQVVVEAKKKNAQDELRKAIKAGRDAQELALACVSGSDKPPARRRYVVNDPTVEKLGELLSVNLRGLLLFRDELTGFLRTLEREGHEADRAFYLEAWNGTGRFTYDRIGRGTVEIEAACISILGGIQPGPLGAYVRGAAQGKGGDDGLIQRFQLAVFPDLPATWVNHDRTPHLAARSRASAVFERLDTLTPAAVGAELPDPRFGGVPFLRFTPEAQEIFTEWRTDLEHRLRRGEEPPIIEAHLAKYRSLVPSLALLIHLADEGAGPVGEEPLKRACAWAEYLESHARRIYSPAISPAAAAAKALADHIRKGDLTGPFTVREVYRNQWRGLTNREEVSPGLDLLEALGWVRGQEERGEGRPTVSYEIHPQVSPQEAGNG